MKKYCNNCGQPLLEEAKFCNTCGTKVEDIIEETKYTQEDLEFAKYLIEQSNIEKQKEEEDEDKEKEKKVIHKNFEEERKTTDSINELIGENMKMENIPLNLENEEVEDFTPLFVTKKEEHKNKHKKRKTQLKEYKFDNYDGYYNDVLPIDIGDNYKKKNKLKDLILIVGVGIVGLVLLYIFLFSDYKIL